MPGKDSSGPELNSTAETITHEGVGDESNNANNIAQEELSSTNSKSDETNGHAADDSVVNSGVTVVISSPDTTPSDESVNEAETPLDEATANDKPDNVAAIPDVDTSVVKVVSDGDDVKPVIDEGGDSLPPPPADFIAEQPRPDGECGPHNVVVNVDDANFSPDDTLITNIDEILDQPEQAEAGDVEPAPTSPLPSDLSASKKVEILTFSSFSIFIAILI